MFRIRKKLSLKIYLIQVYGGLVLCWRCRQSVSQMYRHLSAYCLENMETSTSHNHMGLHGRLQGSFTFVWKYCMEHYGYRICIIYCNLLHSKISDHLKFPNNLDQKGTSYVISNDLRTGTWNNILMGGEGSLNKVLNQGRSLDSSWVYCRQRPSISGLDYTIASNVKTSVNSDETVDGDVSSMHVLESCKKDQTRGVDSRLFQTNPIVLNVIAKKNGKNLIAEDWIGNNSCPATSDTRSLW
jgi:hypothetical protein